MLQTNFSHAILFREGVTQSNYSSTTNIDADTLEIAQLQPHGIWIWIIDLHFVAKWRSPSFKYRREFDLLANLLKIQQRTSGRCSYFQFLSSRLAIFTVSPRKFRRYGDSSFTMGTKCIVWHQIFERQAQRTVLQKLSLRLSCIQFCAWTPSCYHSRRYNLETSVILSLGKCALVATRPHLFHSSPIGRTFIRSFFFIESFYTTWNCFWMTAHKIWIQITFCKFHAANLNIFQ